MKKIYFDHSATTPVDKQVLEKMLPYFSEIYGNASSLHTFGQEAIRAVDQARSEISEILNCEQDEVIFTGGATESNNLAIKGLVKALQDRDLEKIHIITSQIEHEAVLEPIKELKNQKNNSVEVDYCKVDSRGVVDVADLLSKINNNTALISIMYVNSEIGSIQPIREIGKAIEKLNEARLLNKLPKIYFHTDATQAANFFNLNTKHLHVDLLSLSGHKIYGPKGVGLLFAQKKVPLVSLQRGGHHERNLRSGTLNVTGIIGLAEALKLTQIYQEVENKKIADLRNYLVDNILKLIPNTILNTNREVATPSHAHFSFLNVEGEATLIALDLEGIAVSTGSACASSSLVASHVLLAIGIKQEIAHNAIRFTLGKNNTKEEIDKLLEVLPNIISKLRSYSANISY